jgi:peptidoglycan/xylan/chitin deacetylase (PgdA/CDA1 family)
MSPALPILTFHALEEAPAVLAVPPAVFRQGLARLHAAGYRTCSLLEAVAGLRRGAPWPPRAVVLTFDDGYRSVYEEALPVLQRYGMTATVFLTVGPRGPRTPTARLPALTGRPMLSWGEIRVLQQAGLTLGAHTCTHPDLTRLPPARLRAEVCDAQAILQEAMGTPVTTFAYPYGRSDARSRALVREHFACACSDRLGLVTLRSDPYALERVDAYYLRTERRFALVPTRLFPWYIRARSIPRRLRRAVSLGVLSAR